MSDTDRRGFLKMLGIVTAGAAAIPAGLLGAHKVKAADDVVPKPDDLIKYSRAYNTAFDEVTIGDPVTTPDAIIHMGGKETGIHLCADGHYTQILNYLGLQEMSLDVSGHVEEIGYDSLLRLELQPQVSGRFVFVDSKVKPTNVFNNVYRLLGAKPCEWNIKTGGKLYTTPMMITGADMVNAVDEVDRLIIKTISTGEIVVTDVS